MNGRMKAVDHSRTRSKLGLLVRALGWPEQTLKGALTLGVRDRVRDRVRVPLKIEYFALM